jgi:hypothetical protein
VRNGEERDVVVVEKKCVVLEATAAAAVGCKICD